MGRNGFFHEGAMLQPLADLFFETYDGGLGEERAYWRAYGFVLAWPLIAVPCVRQKIAAKAELFIAAMFFIAIRPFQYLV